MEKPAGEESPRRREQNLTRERGCAGVMMGSRSLTMWGRTQSGWR
jgi:hypothetical protein